MNTALKRQLKAMTDDEVKSVLRRDYLRRLTRYRMTDNFYRKKYEMDFNSFEKENIVKQENFNFSVESDAQEWELAIDGIKSMEKKLKELSCENK